jgi:hypothetical protein
MLVACRLGRSIYPRFETYQAIDDSDQNVLDAEDRLSPLKAPIERRNAMRTDAAELVDGLGGMGRLQADQPAVATKILGPDYPRVIADK